MWCTCKSEIFCSGKVQWKPFHSLTLTKWPVTRFTRSSKFCLSLLEFYLRYIQVREVEVAELFPPNYAPGIDSCCKEISLSILAFCNTTECHACSAQLLSQHGADRTTSYVRSDLRGHKLELSRSGRPVSKATIEHSAEELSDPKQGTWQRSLHTSCLRSMQRLHLVRRACMCLAELYRLHNCCCYWLDLHRICNGMVDLPLPFIWHKRRCMAEIYMMETLP